VPLQPQEAELVYHPNSGLLSLLPGSLAACPRTASCARTTPTSAAQRVTTWTSAMRMAKCCAASVGPQCLWRW